MQGNESMTIQAEALVNLKNNSKHCYHTKKTIQQISQSVFVLMDLNHVI